MKLNWNFQRGVEKIPSVGEVQMFSGITQYWPEVMAVRTKQSKDRTKMTEGQYFPVWLKLARLVSKGTYECCAA